MNENTEDSITWGDAVQVVESAPAHMKPGAIGSVYSVEVLTSAVWAAKLGLPLGSRIVSVEFPDSSTLTTTPAFLVKLDGYQSPEPSQTL